MHNVHAASRRSSRTILAGGGAKPKEDPTLEWVLDTLSPASKDGVVARGKGESVPELDDSDDDDDDEDNEDGEASEIDNVIVSDNFDDKGVEGQVGDTPSCSSALPTMSKTDNSIKKRPVLASVFDIEMERLQVEKQQLEVAQNIQCSLADINVTMRMMLAVICNQQNVTVCSENDQQ